MAVSQTIGRQEGLRVADRESSEPNIIERKTLGSWDCDMKSDMNDSSDLEIPIPSVRWYWCVLWHRNFTGRIPARPSSTVGGSSRLR